jgi:hypothetical protein
MPLLNMTNTRDTLKAVWQEHRIFIILLSAFFLIRILSLFRYHILIWDEAVYYGMGKYIFSGGHIGLWEDLRPLMLPLLLGISWKMGISLRMTEIIPILFSTGTVLLTYLIAKTVWNKQSAILASLFLMITPLFFLYSSYYLTEIPACFFALLAIYLYIRHRPFISGFIIGIAFLTKFPVVLILVSVLFSIVVMYWRSKRTQAERKNLIHDGFYLILGFAIVFLCFFVFNLVYYHDSAESGFFSTGMHTLLKARMHEKNPFLTEVRPITFFDWIYYYTFYVLRLFLQNPSLVCAILSLAYIAKKEMSVNTEKRRKLAMTSTQLLATTLIICSFLVFLLYFSIIENKQIRFGLLILPYLCMLAGYGAWKFFQDARKTVSVIFVIIIGLFLCFSGYACYKIYFYKPAQMPSAVQFFSGIPKNTIIATSTPLFVVYSDDLFLPYYFSPKEGLALYPELMQRAEYLIFDDKSFRCEEHDQECIAALKALTAAIHMHTFKAANSDGYSTYQLYAVKKA